MTFKQLAEFYQQLARLLDSGLPIAEALTFDVFPDFPEISQVQNSVLQGCPLAASLQLAGVLPARDLILIQAAEESGRLPNLLKALAQRHAEKQRLVTDVRKKLGYPAFLLLLAGIILPLPQLIMGQMAFYQFVLRLIMVWGGLFLAALALYMTAKNLVSHPGWARSNRWAIKHLPFAGKLITSWYLEDYFATLAMMTAAGVPLAQAMFRAEATVPSVYLKSQLQRSNERLAAGQNLSEAFQPLPFLKKEHHLQFRTGEKTGRLDESFWQVATGFRESNLRQVEVFGAVLPKVVYFAVVIYIAGGIIVQYLDYFDMLERISDGL